MNQPGGPWSARAASAFARHPWVRRVRTLAAGERSGEPLLLALAATVGLGTGLLAVALIEAVSLVQHLSWGSAPAMWQVVAIPTLGALLVGLLVTYWMPEARGGGVGEVMTSIALHGGRMRPGLAFGKLLTSALNLGTGASGGREGPITQIGGSVGSTVGRLLALNEEQKRSLIAAGAGAGIAASFNAPIGGMLFALEVILGGFRARYLQTVVVASVVASVTAREIIGPELIYDPPPYRLSDPRELLLYALLGLAAALLGVLFILGEDRVGVLVQRLKLWPPLRLALGGAGVGLIALALPQVLGTGDHLPPVAGLVREPIADMLAGGSAGMAAADAAAWRIAALLLVLLGAKLLATVLTLGTGNSAGSFSPAVFLGAALGSAFGHIAVTLLPNAGVSPGAFALVGMAGVLGASVRAPLTAILLAFELTGDYGMVLPLMLTTGIATMVAERLQRDSLYTLPLRRRGIVYGEPENIDIMQTVQVSEIMTRTPVTVPADLPVAELHERFRRTRLHGFPVMDGERLVGVVTVTDLSRASDSTGDLMAPAGPAAHLTAADICTPRPLTVTPSDPVFRALRRMAALDVGRLPVVDEQDHGRLVGLVRRADIVKAYQRAVSRTLGEQQRRASSRLRDLGGTQFVELVVHADSEVSGQPIRAVPWPPRTLVTAVRRRGEIVMPRGDTVLEPADELVVLASVDSVDAVRDLVTGATRDAGA